MKCRNVFCREWWPNDGEMPSQCFCYDEEGGVETNKYCRQRILFNRVLKAAKYKQRHGDRFLEYVEKEWAR